MKLSTLVSVLDSKFDIAHIHEDWSWIPDTAVPKERIFPGFLKSSVGLFIQSSEEVTKIYTACFAGSYVISQIEKKGVKDVLLIVKHPLDWDKKRGFLPFTKEDLEIIHRFRINIYSVHTPMDKNRNEAGLLSTAYAFAKAINFKPEGEFAKEGPKNPVFIGVQGRVIEQDLAILARGISSRIKHDVKVWKNNSQPVRRIGIVTGGANERRFIIECKGLGIDTFITGVVEPNDYPPSEEQSSEFMASAKKLQINVICASHYLTEKYAMELSIPYFSKLGLSAEFLEDLEAWNRLE